MATFDVRRKAPPERHQGASLEQERGQVAQRPLASDPQAILALQRSIGNRAVASMLAQRRPDMRRPQLQRRLTKSNTYRAIQAEVGKNKTGGGDVSLAQHNNTPSTTVGQLYLVADFKRKQGADYTQLQPVTEDRPAFFVPDGNPQHDQQYYQRENTIPTLANGGTDLMTKVVTATGNPYNNQAPSAQDVTQGNVGNCWLLAPMMAMAGSAHWRDTLANAVTQNQANYDVRLGTPNAQTAPGQVLQNQQVTVSGQLPAFPSADTNRDELLYGQMNRGIPDQIGQGAVTWPALMEKAIAQSWGNNSYQSLDDNNASLGFQLLGATQPFTLQPPDTASQEYAALIQGLAQGAAATATTVRNGDNGKVLSTTDNDAQEIAAADYRLIEDHVYIITAVTQQNMTLSNPHGRNHPSGPIPTNQVANLIARIDYLPGAPQQGGQPQGGQQQPVVVQPQGGQQQGGQQQPVVVQPQGGQPQQGGQQQPVVVQPQGGQPQQGGQQQPVAVQPQGGQQQPQGGQQQPQGGQQQPVVVQPQGGQQQPVVVQQQGGQPQVAPPLNVHLGKRKRN